MIQRIRARLSGRGDSGASAVEYGLLIAGIAAVIAVLMVSFGDAVGKSFQHTCDGLAPSGSGPSNSVTCNH